MKKIGIIGLGNPLQKDDGIGILLLEKLSQIKEELPVNIKLIDGGTGGMNLLHDLARFDKILIIDAVNLNQRPGDTKFFDINDIVSKKISLGNSTHESDFTKIIQLSKNLDEAPDKIFVFGIQPKDVSFDQNLSEDLAEKLDIIFEDLVCKIKDISQ